MSLFDFLEDRNRSRPLADRIRPDNFEHFYGHENLISPGSPIRKLIDSNNLTSMILWGPPGSGKTTLARIIARITNSYFKEVSAVSSGIKDLRDIVQEAKDNLKSTSTRTILFIDEIHRYNKAQQDAILPYVEDGTVILIGATTENPSFEVIPALRSRVQILKLSRLSPEELKKVLIRAVEEKEKGLGELNLTLPEESLNFIINYSAGDARFALNLLEAASKIVSSDKDLKNTISVNLLQKLIQQASVLYDKSADEHYDHLSAYQKSLRGSDVNAALYWLAKMLVGGEDPRVIARRLLVCASEDVSNANPMALVLASNAFDAVSKLGMPEARIPLAQATIYVALAAKSNSSIVAIDKAMNDIKEGKTYPVPLHLKDTHYKDAAKYGHGTDYIYSHSNPYAEQQFLPDELKNVKYYNPESSEERKRFNLDK